ncbi:hypothetical protein TNCV_1238171 [Trichonephila clavipes]|nr:hypothetical protein TNCV_1238171 [Trichonephila clavipes]
MAMSEKSGDIEENMEESPIKSEFIEVTPEQACNNLQLLWGLARSKEAKLNYIKAELPIQEKTPIFNEEKIANFNKDKATLEEELQSALALLEAKKAEHYVIDRLANQPIKGLPVDTDVADIEVDLVQKGFAIEKVVQLRKFTTKVWSKSAVLKRRRTFMK